ncbi:signal peptidase I [Lachnotalea glycerini]|uniref:Signal peptidase I n=2 Tax=Lachnotalea glycerini TaxID=1763509 RepID=A0A318EV33_9FIRM|nr:signal peptidase I [Lachnotalea glycerini]PXV96092.1 signal peptidase I [Lachnotalea glycerini]
MRHKKGTGNSMEIKRNKGDEENKSMVRELVELLIYMGVVLALAGLIVTFVGQRTMVSGSSMESTLSDKDNLIVDKITYRFSNPKRFDIIVFPFQYQKDTYYIKRIIGLPGETVQIIDGDILINGEVLEETYGRERIESSGRASEPIILGDDEYFVMGDNRNASADSREPDVGNIKREDIIGRAWVRIWPLNKFGVLKHQ